MGKCVIFCAIPLTFFIISLQLMSGTILNTFTLKKYEMIFFYKNVEVEICLKLKDIVRMIRGSNSNQHRSFTRNCIKMAMIIF